MNKYGIIMDHLNLPPVPDDLAKIVLETEVDLTKAQNPLPVRVLTEGGKPYRSRRTPRIGLESQLGAWVTENITDKWDHVGMAKSTPVDPIPGGHPQDNKRNGPHTDCTRNFLLLYLLDRSNPDQDTVFWQEKGKPIYREHSVYVNEDPTPTEELVELERVTFPLNTWCYVDSRVVHSVENILGRRTALHIGFWEDPFDVFPKNPFEDQAQ